MMNEMCPSKIERNKNDLNGSYLIKHIYSSEKYIVLVVRTPLSMLKGYDFESPFNR